MMLLEFEGLFVVVGHLIGVTGRDLGQPLAEVVSDITHGTYPESLTTRGDLTYLIPNGQAQ